jgi:hypothetical protein
MANKALIDLHDQGMEVMKVQNKTGLSLGADLLDACNAGGLDTNISQLRRALLIAENWDAIQQIDGFPEITVKSVVELLRGYS